MVAAAAAEVLAEIVCEAIVVIYDDNWALGTRSRG